MELVVQPDVYCPSVNEQGNYIDKMPAFHFLNKGLICPCGTRKDKKYENSVSFSTHMKTKAHIKWLADLNANKVNYYDENRKLKEQIQQYKLIIAHYQKDIQTKSNTIDCLAQQLQNLTQGTNQSNLNLMDFD
jgi:hypothetical protein